MGRNLINQLENSVGQRVTLKGYTENYREFKDFSFLFVRDRTGICQTIVPKEVYGKKIDPEDVVEVEGDVVENKKSQYSGIEVIANDLSFISKGKPGKIPRKKDKRNFDLTQKLDSRPAALKLNELRNPLEFKSDWLHNLRNFLHQNEFMEVETPKIVAPEEGGAKNFGIDYFGNKAQLSQSPQLYHQMLLSSIERVYEIGHCFRAEKYSTHRHVNEYQSLDFEIAFTSSSEEIMSFIEEMIHKSSTHEHIFPETIPKINYLQAMKKLGKNEERKLSGRDKKNLGRWAKENKDSNFLFVYDLPLKTSQFYTMPKDKNFGDNFKLLYEGVEVATGGQRINDPVLIEEHLTKKGLDPRNFKHYLDAFDCGIPPHSGASMGIPRFVSVAKGLESVKEAIYFPRDPRRINP